MADIYPAVLDAAKRLGLFKRRLSDDQKTTIRQTIVTAASIKNYIDDCSVNGATIEQIASGLDLNENTVKMYSRWLYKADLIDRESLAERGAEVTYFTLKSHLARARK
jgi:FixJ family two-component response regulator